MLKVNNLFLIGAADRNVGKTELACTLIKNETQNGRKVIGVKVTTIKDDSHGTCPRGGKGCGVCTSLSEDFCLTHETDSSNSKDTSRMLRAGASAVYWLRVREKALKKGALALLEKIKTSHCPDVSIVCESNSLRRVIEPGLFFILNRSNNANIKNSCKEVERFADKKVTLLSVEQGFDFELNRISFENNRWDFRTDASCIILAGGKSSRMGEDKTKLKVNGLTLLESSIKQLKPLFSEILISSNNEEELSYLKLPVIKDSENGHGPLMGIYNSLQVSKSERNFVIACDIPEPDISLIYKLLSIDSSFDVVIPRHDGNMLEPLFAVYSKNTLPFIKESIKTSKQIRAFFDKVNTCYIDTDLNFFNINTSNDYNLFLEKKAVDESKIAR
ncbi:MAG TPA: hypothetical protein DD381_01225 [Lentisphaeria bacterium]|nr:MAG: hypothetical protein A2X47_13435 [Lentisphaerae bacterium GWF2_38_69]HBM14965.1 hypothetical protein [Lentisphaeria bacterium]